MDRVSVHAPGHEDVGEQHPCPTRLSSLLQLPDIYLPPSPSLYSPLAIAPSPLHVISRTPLQANLCGLLRSFGRPIFFLSALLFVSSIFRFSRISHGRVFVCTLTEYEFDLSRDLLFSDGTFLFDRFDEFENHVQRGFVINGTNLSGFRRLLFIPGY